MPGSQLPASPGQRLRARAGQLLRSLLPPRPLSRRQVLYELFVTALVVGLGAAVGYGELDTTGGRVLALLGAAALMLARLRFPALALSGAGVLAGFVQIGGIPLLVATSYAAGFRSSRWWRLGLAHVVAVTAQFVGPWREREFQSYHLVFVVAYVLLFVVLPVLVARSRAQHRALLDALRERNAFLERERLVVSNQARLRERTRIAREMHDSLGHQLTLVSLHAGGLEIAAELPESQLRAVRVLRDGTQAALQELRQIIGVLTQEDDADRGQPHTLDDLDELFRRSREAGMDVRWERLGKPFPLAPAIEHAAYRVVQEGLTNAHKYAPGARVDVCVRFSEGGLLVDVENTPPTSPVPEDVSSGGQGLIGLRERVRVAGGRLAAGPTMDGGYRLAATLPDEPPTNPPTAAEEGPGVPLPPPESTPAVGLRVGIGLALFALVGCVFLTVLVTQDLPAGDPVQRSLYEQAGVGQPEQDVRRKLPLNSIVARDDVHEAGGPTPAGSFCEEYPAVDEPLNGADLVAYRFCFRGDKLAHKEIVRVPSS
ncbi:sensor histidine kinase [Longimycelium tulufanense]|uniref:sensor histidine kinase n=1 Tax=Longimycelium tulufanense TaxID=907463 RepID=UPI001665BB03|nr:histidine kinase [Longimycelium tulufanense]